LCWTPCPGEEHDRCACLVFEELPACQQRPIGRAAGSRRAAPADPDRAAAVEVVVVARGAHDCWVAGRAAGGRRLLVALEGRGEDSLLEASALAAGFVDAHFAGLLE